MRDATGQEGRILLEKEIRRGEIDNQYFFEMFRKITSIGNRIIITGPKDERTMPMTIEIEDGII